MAKSDANSKNKSSRTLKILLGAFVVLVLLMALGMYGMWKALTGTDREIGTFPCDQTHYVITRNNSTTMNNYAMVIKIKEKTTGIVLRWPMSFRYNDDRTPVDQLTHPVTHEKPMVLKFPRSTPKQILDITVEKPEMNPGPHSECLRAILPDVIELLKTQKTPPGVPAPIRPDDDTILVWSSTRMF